MPTTGSRVISDGGLILVRESDELVSFSQLSKQHFGDPRQGMNTQFPLAELPIRPVGRSSHKPLVPYKGYLYLAAS